MDIETLVDLKPFDSQITAIVPKNDLASELTPLSRHVERLVHVTIESEGGVSHRPVELEVGVPLFKSFEAPQLGVASIPHRRTSLLAVLPRRTDALR